MKRVLMIVLAATTSLAVAACGPTAREKCEGAKDVVTCIAAANSGSDASDLLMGGLAGAAISSALSRPAGPTIIHHSAPMNVADRRAYRPYGFTPSKTVTTTATRRSLLGSRTVTTTTRFRTSYRSRR